MVGLFLKTLNVSIAASWLILAVVLFRSLLKKTPRWIVVLLWGIVALRLAVPFSFESPWSLIPSAETFDIHNIQYETPAIQSGIPAVSHAVNAVLGETFAPDPAASVNPLYVCTFMMSVIWIIGIAAMLLYAAISYGQVRKSVAERIPYGENIFLCDQVRSPFILGLVRPKIYLPSSMDGMAMEPVIAHEKAHLARHDHWWKPMGFLILTVHWYNPLCWVAYVLLCRDIELACDEKVIRQMDLDGRKQYSAALLACSTGRRLVTVCPLAFGEISVKERVKNVLGYKKPAFWVMVAAVIACAVVTVCFATDPKGDLPQELHTVQARITEVEDRAFLAAPVEGSWELSSSDLFRVPITDVTDMSPSPEPQVGDVLEITYDGTILESYPAQFGTVYSVRVVSWEDSLEIDTSRAEDQGSISDIHAMPGPEGVPVSPTEDTATPITSEPDVAAPTPTTVDPDIVAPTLSEEQAAIRQAIIAHNKSPWSQEYDAACCSFITLETLSGTPLAGSSTHTVTYYGWALYEEYKVTDDGLEVGRGSHVPVAISFDLDERGYTLTGYWEPRDGGDYAQDIRKKFPAHIAQDGMDSQKFVLRQIQECRAQAVASTGLDTGQEIERLIRTICSSPAQSSDPGAYIKEHPTEYRELTYYGQYTLRYCFDRFEAGSEDGLAGQIMMEVCEDIATGWGEGPLMPDLPADGVRTGQLWYSAFKSNALRLAERYTETELEERYPASYLLLSMLGKV